MTVIQLQLNLWQQLEQSQAEPQATDWHQLCLAFDRAINRTPVWLRLAITAEAISQMATVVATRADVMAQIWARRPGEVPGLDEDLFSDFGRQSFSLDLSDLVAYPVFYRHSGSEMSHGEGESAVEYRKKDEVLLESFVLEESGVMF